MPFSSDFGAVAALEVEHHLHSWERWLCIANAPTGTHKADTVIAAEAIPAWAPFIVDAGNDAFGGWIQLLGSGDTPVQADKLFFDLHRLILTSVERDRSKHILQIGYGADGPGALSDGTYSDLPFIPDDGPPITVPVPVEAQMERIPVGSLVFARLWIPGQDTGTLGFEYGIHEYDY